MISISLIALAGAAKADNLVTVTSEGWSVSLDEEQRTFSISHENLGTVLKDVRLNLRGERGLNPLKNWSVEKKGQNQLSLRTVKPTTAWLIELGSNTLKISSTSTDAVLTASAPASTDRITARLLDPQGVPVSWVGTHEIMGYEGAGETRNPSFLPSRNPEVMYFGLGPVSSSNLHSFFDRKTDTAIDFSDQTVMQRSRQDADLLEITIPVPGSAVVRFVPDYYTKTLGVPYYVPFDDSYFPKAPVVWCSWDSCYDSVREEDVVRNTDWIAAHLKPYGFDYIVLDDGYDRGKHGEHYWIERWNQEKFPHGPKWLTSYIKSKGLHPGVWIVPNGYAGAVEQHPDWYLRYKKDGRIVLDYATPTLDPTNPEVLDFLKKEFTTLDDWGFEYYKFDGEHDYLKYVPGVDLDKIYDKSIDPIVAYRNRLKLIRETIGPERFIEGCPSGTPLNGIGYFNSYFNGEDLYPSWQGNYSMFSSINANAFLNHILVYAMVGEGIEVGPRMSFEEAMKKKPAPVLATARTREDPLVGFGATLAEARTVVSYASLTGVVYSLSSVMPELPEERVKLLKMTLPSMPILPLDLFSRGTDMPMWDLFKHTTPDTYIHNYPEILDLKVNAKSGVYDVVGLTNWRGETATRELSFADKLGLEPDARYIAFDYWGQKLAGVYKDRMKVVIEPHDTRVFLVHPVLHRPQLVGTSRHITGAYSIKELAWDGAQKRLRGASDTVPGDDYTLWFYVPEGFTVAQVRATSPGKGEIPARHEVTGNSLGVSFPGQHEAVNWEVEFAAHSSK
jgi:hypothetical protein